MPESSEVARTVNVSPMKLSGLFLYPVKSLRGFAVTHAAVDALGLVGDRRFLVLDEQGRTLTQRESPQMASIQTELTTTDLLLHSRGVAPIAVPLRSCGSDPLVTVSVWKSTGLLAEDCGIEASAWLSARLGAAARLVRIGEKFIRPVLNPLHAKAGDVVSFADAYPFLVVSEASLAELNARLRAAREDPVPMSRFRPNLVVSGCNAFDEDRWPRLQIGEIVFRSGGPCSRCVVTTTDQVTGARGKEPLRMLSTYRRDPVARHEVNFGHNLIHENKSGVLRIGDSVTLPQAPRITP